jgi:hypothetical protein
MGKGLTFVVSLAALACLGLLFATANGSLPREAGLLFGFLSLAAAAWVLAALTAGYQLLRHGYGWRWLVALVALIWLPALPALCFSLSGLFGRRNQRAAANITRLPSAVTIPAAPDETLLRWPLRDEVTA